MDAIWKKWNHVLITRLIISLQFTYELWFIFVKIINILIYMLKSYMLRRCTYRARHRSGYEGYSKRGFSGVVPFTQPTLALLIVVPVYGREGHVSEECGPQTPPQRQPAFSLHCRADAISQLPVRLFLRLQLRANQLQRADHRRWTHWHTQNGERTEGWKSSKHIFTCCWTEVCKNQTVAEKTYQNTPDNNDLTSLIFTENHFSVWRSILMRVVHHFINDHKAAFQYEM